MYLSNSILLVLVCHLLASSAIIVSLPNGNVEGLTNTTLAGTVYHSFLALRYAQPPVGELRLESPKPVKSWEGLYDATKEKYICHQVRETSDLENEDCLFANVFTPKDLKNIPLNSDLAVLAWIHGGGFVSGSGYISKSGFGPKFFMDAGVILVTFNYRLGPFGFLSTGDKTIPGNFGLKDQLMALKWIQKNIAYFGGDPKKVTIFGQSSGGSSVGYQLLSGHSKGLYRAAIMESGSALSAMGYQRNQTDYTFKTISLIDSSFNYTNSEEVLTFLRNVSASVLDKAAFNLVSTTESPANYQISKGFMYAPSIEVCHSGAFFTRPQYEMLQKGYYRQVPVLIGNTDEESLALAKLGDLSFLSNAYDANPSIMVPFDMHINSDETKKIIGAKILNNFAGADGFNNDTVALIKYHSVHDLDRGNVKQAELMAHYSPVYFYQFAYSGQMGNNLYKIPGAGKVAHSEDLNYLFSRKYSDEIPDNSNLTYFSEADQLVHFRFISLWTNFAKYCNPTPPGIDEELLQNVTWQQVEPNEFRYLEIAENLVMKSGYPKPSGYQFWVDLYDKYAIPPLDTF